jgi:hypothetical protein
VCVTLWRRSAWCCGVHGRMADGVRGMRRSVRTVGVSTDGHGRAALAAFPGLTCAPESGVHPRVSPVRVIARDEGGRDGRCADGWAGGAGARDACRARSGRGSPARLWAVGRSRLPVRGIRPSCWGARRGKCAARRLGRPRGEGHCRGQDGRQYGPGGGH